MNNAAPYGTVSGPTLLDDHGYQSDYAADPRGTPLIREYLAIVARRKWVILAIVALALLAGLVATMLATPQFTASSRIEISRQEQRITNLEGVEAGDRRFDTEFYDTQYELLRTRPIAERVARELRLAQNMAFFEAHGLDPATVDFLDTGDAAPTREQLQQREATAVGLLLGNISINPVERSALVDIGYTSAAPAISAQVANEWAKQFIAESIDRRFASTADASEFLVRRLAELRQAVEDSERQLVTYANENDIVILDRVEQDGKTVSTPTLTATNLQAMNEALMEATARRVELESQANAGGGSSVAQNSSLASLRNRRSELAAQYAQLMVQFEPGYPAARALQEQISELDASISREEARLQRGSRDDFRAALQREQTLRARVNELTNQLRGQERARIQYNIFQNEVDTNRELYEGVLQRYREIGVASVGASNISVVDEAQVPGAPSSPNLPLNLLVALFGGFALAGIAVFMLEQLDEGIREPGEVTALTGLPMLGAVPSSDQDQAEIVNIIQDPKSELSEAYLTIRSNLAMSTEHGVPKSLMVTSTRPAEGKSTTSFALASVLARTGKKVALIDADMRSPSVHELFALPNQLGFSNFLTGEEDISSLLAQTPTENLWLMTAGRTPPSAAELLSTDRAAELIGRLLESFDHVIVDSPPLLGLADAPLLSRSVEGVVYVVEARGVAARGINMSLDRLRDSHAHLLGAVMTKFSGKDSASYGYGYGYGYGLKYGQDDEAAR